MTRANWITATVLLAATPLAAQQGPVGRTAVVVEAYSFDAGLDLGDVIQLTVPVGVSIPLHRFVDFSVAGGFTTVHILPSDDSDDLSVSGALDTELRLSWQAVPGNLIVFVNGAIPTGVDAVDQEDLSVVSILASDLIGFTANTLGAGGNLGFGFAGAVPLGRWAFGLGGTFREPLSYNPVAGQPETLKPGREIRLRGGLEGPLGARSYMRLAGIAAFRAKDEVAEATANGVGNRYMGYLSIDQGVANATVTLYLFDVFRSDPRVEETALGAALLPRSNLLATGARFAIPLGASTTFVPRVEFRNSWAAADTADAALENVGRTFRVGADLRQMVGQHFGLVLQGGALFGSVQQLGGIPTGTDVDVRGFRGGLHFEVYR